MAHIIGIIGLVIVIGVIIFLSISFYITIFGGGPFVPTKMKAVHKVLKAAKIEKGQRVYDIGCGDGRFVHFAAKDYGADSVGFELDPFVYFLAKLRQKLWKWQGIVKRGNFLKHDFSDADIIVCYLLPKTLAKYQKKFDKELKKGTRIVSYAFHIGDWEPKKLIPREKGINGVHQIWVYEI